MTVRFTVLILMMLVWCGAAAEAVSAQRHTAAVRGTVRDEQGAAVTTANISLHTVTTEAAEAAATLPVTTRSNASGAFYVRGVAAGNYRLRVTAQGFADYEKPVTIQANRTENLEVQLAVKLDEIAIDVESNLDLATTATANANQIVWREDHIAALPYDVRERNAMLQILVEPPVELAGREILVDGFSNARIPPNDSIKEIRINQHPFAAEFERPGAGRIEIFTKAGTERLRGTAFGNYTDAAFNSRYPFAPRRVPYVARNAGGNLSNKIIENKFFYFVDSETRATIDNAVVNATILDDALSRVNVRQSFLSPDYLTVFNARTDYNFTSQHSLIARYSLGRNRSENSGIGNFSLASRGFTVTGAEHGGQFILTSRLSPVLINEARVQVSKRQHRQRGDARNVAVNVLEAFTGGGSSINLNYNDTTRFELQNYATRAFARHVWRAGGRLRVVSLSDASSSNFNGQYTFAGGSAPRLDAHANPLPNPFYNPDDAASSQWEMTSIDSLERYRRTLWLQQSGFTPNEIRERGGGATQFSIAGGNAEIAVRQIDVALFAQDEWQARENLNFNFGLRYENQTNIASRTDFAPRIGFAWSPTWLNNKKGNQAAPNFVLRGGVGIFYERFSEQLSLQAIRFDGTNRNQTQFIVRDTDVLDLFPRVPSVDSLATFEVRQTARRISRDVRSPRTMFAQAGVERRLPWASIVSLNLSHTITNRVLRSRVVKASLNDAAVMTNADEPEAATQAENIFQYEASGRFAQNRMQLTVDNRRWSRIKFSLSYTLAKAMSDTDGAGTFPRNSDDLSTEWGRAASDVRHSFTLSGTLKAPFGIQLNPFIAASSGRAFNITTGRDANGDTVFTERPAFATDASASSVIQTPFGLFDTEPKPHQTIIPRNYGHGAPFLLVNLRVGKTYDLTNLANAATRRLNAHLGGNAKLSELTRKYNLTVAVQIQNLLNRINLATPPGNLRSPQFNVSNSIASGFGYINEPAAGNRRIEAQLRLTF